MAKRIQVVVDVQSESVQFATDQTLTLTQQVRLLRQELQKVPEGTAEWTVLQSKYNETKDSLDRVNVKSKELFGTMSSLPGPIGQVAGQLDNTIGTLKTFSGIKFSDIKTQFGELTKDIVGIGKNIADVTGITKVYTVINNALAASFVKVGVGEAAAAAGARTFAAALTATGIGAIVVALGLAVSALIDFMDNTEESTAAVDEFNASLAEQNRLLNSEVDALEAATQQAIARAKIAGKSEQELYEISKRAGESRLELLRSNDEILYNKRKELSENTVMDAKDKTKALEDLDKELLKSNSEIIKQINANEQGRLDYLVKVAEKGRAANEKAAQKRKELSDKEVADRNKALGEISKGEEEGFKATLTVREREEYEINQKYVSLIALATKYGQDTTILETGRLAELATMRDKFNKEDADKQKKKDEDDLKAIQDANKAKLEAGQAAIALKQAQDQQNIDLETVYRGQLDAIGITYAENETERINILAASLEFYKGKQQDYAEAIKNVNSQIAESWVSLAQSIGQSFSSLANIFDDNEGLQKAFAIVGVLINAASAIGKVALTTQESVAEFSKTISTGTATVASGVALSSNPVTLPIGLAQIAAGKAAIATGTAGIAAAKSNAARQKVAIGITSATQVAAILATKKSSSGAAAASAGGGGASAGPSTVGGGGTSTISGAVNVPAPVIGATEANRAGNLGEIIVGAVQRGNSVNRPIQAYVVGDQINTYQQLDRRISAAARMGG